MCSQEKIPPRKYKAPLKAFNVGAPFERIALDILGPLPRTKQGNKSLLVIGDYFSKWLDAIPLRNQEAPTIAKKLVERIVSILVFPFLYILTKVQTLSLMFFVNFVNYLELQKRVRPHCDPNQMEWSRGRTELLKTC